MKISRFFENVLGIKLANIRWSWGAEDEVRNRVFLRVWDDEFSPDRNRVLVLRGDRPQTSNGYRQRLRHLDAMRRGAKGLGIVCIAKQPIVNGKRVISEIKQDDLQELGELIEIDSNVYATVIGTIPVSSLKAD